MRADVSTNSCTNQRKTNDDLGRQPAAPHDMAAANRTLSCVKKKKTSSVLMNSLKLHISVWIYLTRVLHDMWNQYIDHLFEDYVRDVLLRHQPNRLHDLSHDMK